MRNRVLLLASCALAILLPAMSAAVAGPLVKKCAKCEIQCSKPDKGDHEVCGEVKCPSTKPPAAWSEAACR